MANTRTLNMSFAGGEISPELYSRQDLDKFASSSQLCRNFFVLPYGPVQRRSGFRFVNEVKFSNRRTRILPFAYSVDDTVIIELGHQYARFHTKGGTIVDAPRLITSVTDLGTPGEGPINITINTPNPSEIALGASIFAAGRFFKIASVLSVNPPGTMNFNITLTAGDGYTATPFAPGDFLSVVYEIPLPYVEADLFGVHFVQSNDVLTLSHPKYPPAELRRFGITDWRYEEISFQPLLDAPRDAVARRQQGSGSIRYRYKVTAQTQTGVEESFASKEALGTNRKNIAARETFNTFDITAISNATVGVFTTASNHNLAVNNLIYVTGIVAAGITDFDEGWYLVRSVPTANTLTLKTEDEVDVDTSANAPYVPGGDFATLRRCAQFQTTQNHGYTRDDPVLLTLLDVDTALNDKVFRVGRAVTADIIALKDDQFEQVEGLPSVANFGTQNGRITEVGILNDLTVNPNKNKITWSAVPGAFSYRVYKEKNGTFGFVGQALTTVFIDDNITPDLSQSPPEDLQPFIGEGNYPSTVTYFDQRRCFAATDNLPQTVYMTRPSTESNLTSAVPTKDNDAIVLKIAAREQNRIRHMVPLGDLLLLTAGGEWRVFTGSGDAITPATVQARPQSYVGSNNVQPVVTNLSIIYVSAQGSRFRELNYTRETQGYQSTDLSVLTPHLCDTFSMLDIAYARAPVPSAWAVRDDGVMLGLTYLPEQQIRSWHRHDTDGKFESVAVAPEFNEDALYAVVQREVEGQVRRFIERRDSQQFENQEDCFYVDAGISYRGAATTEISNLWHLNGKTVQILADGAVVTPQVVVGGKITLPAAAEVVHAGLPFVSDFQTLPLVVAAAANGIGYPKNIPKVYLRVFRSSNIQVGPSEGLLREFKQRTTEFYGAAPALITDEIEIPLDTTWSQGGTIFIRQSQPLPLMLQSLAMEVTIGA